MCVCGAHACVLILLIFKASWRNQDSVSRFAVGARDVLFGVFDFHSLAACIGMYTSLAFCSV